MESKLKILVWNVQWGRLPEKVERLNKEMRQEIDQYDVVCLVEAYKPREYADLREGLTGFSCLHLENRIPTRKKISKIGGIAIYVKTRETKNWVELEGRGDEIEGLVKWLKINGETFGFKADVYVCVVYLPVPDSVYWGRAGAKSSDKESKFFEMIGDGIAERSRGGDMVIVAGDFNCRIGDFQERRSRDKGSQRRPQFEKLVNDGQLYILNGRKRFPSSSDYTCYKEVNLPTVIDYAMVSEYHREGVVEFKIGALDKKFELENSDHCSLSIGVSAATKDPTRKFEKLDLGPSSASGKAGTSDSVKKEIIKKEEHIVRCDLCCCIVPISELSPLEVEVLQYANRRLRLYCEECEE